MRALAQGQAFPKVNFTVVVFLAAVSSALMIASGILATRISVGSWLDFALTAEQTRDFLYSYTPREVALHRWMTMHIALAMPITLAAFAITMIHHSLGRGRYEFLVALAVWGSVADYAENLVIISLLDGGGAYGLKAALTVIKLTLVLLPQTVALYLFLKYARTRLLAA